MVALDLSFRGNAASFSRSKTARFLAAAIVGFSGLAAHQADAASGMRPVLAAAKVKPDFATAEKTPIPTAHCNYLYDRVIFALKADRNAISSQTKKSLTKFYAYDENKLPTCTGPREIAWEKGSDYDAIISLADSATDAFKDVVDFRIGYGFRPAARPTPAILGPGAIVETPRVN